jgi:hypothetical protein
MTSEQSGQLTVQSTSVTFSLRRQNRRQAVKVNSPWLASLIEAPGQDVVNMLASSSHDGEEFPAFCEQMVRFAFVAHTLDFQMPSDFRMTYHSPPSPYNQQC